MKMSEKQGVRVITIPDKDQRQNLVKLVKVPSGDIYLEVQARHNDVEVYTTLRLGALWELLPRLASLT
jgi:hypothetical protein